MKQWCPLYVFLYSYDEKSLLNFFPNSLCGFIKQMMKLPDIVIFQKEILAFSIWYMPIGVELVFTHSSCYNKFYSNLCNTLHPYQSAGSTDNRTHPCYISLHKAVHYTQGLLSQTENAIMFVEDCVPLPSRNLEYYKSVHAKSYLRTK